MRAANALFALMIGSGPAFAQSMPEIDPVAMCKRMVSTVGQSAWLMKACLDQEQQAYDLLKLRWESIDPKARAVCIRQVRTISQGYWLLQACIEQETDAQQAVDKFKFKR